MIQEKDFLYRVPVKTAPITTPGGQIRNPEILVDVEGGEFMHGNILDANSTNKLINQSVKDAVDNKLIEGGYVTKDLLEAETTRATEQENSLKTLIGAETSARTKGDEDLSSKIKAEQTRAEGKEKEISDKLAIVNGDSNTEGSFRKAIADVVAAAPEDLDTLKEIADKLAGNDDLHTALNQAITEKADASALLNEVSRATGVENNLKTAIDGKQDAGYYVPYVMEDGLKYTLQKGFMFGNKTNNVAIDDSCVCISIGGATTVINHRGINGSEDNDYYSIGWDSINLFNMGTKIEINPIQIASVADDDTNLFNIGSDAIILGPTNNPNVRINEEGIKFKGKSNSDIPTAGGSFISLSSLASEEDISNLRIGISKKQDKITVNEVDITDIETADITKLRTIVTDLINALAESNLIRKVETIE